jgi:hypothetical protein
MTTPVDTVRDFYQAIAVGDTGKMVGLMAPGIGWTSVVDFNIQDRGPEDPEELCAARPSGTRLREARPENSNA